MRITQVISYYYPAWSYGGPGKLVHEITQILASLGHDLAVVTTDAYNGIRRRSKNDNNLVHRQFKFNLIIYRNISNSLAYSSKIFSPLINLIKLSKQIKDTDIVHIHEFFTPLAVVTSFLADRIGVPYLISSHGTLDKFHLNHRKYAKKIFMFFRGNKILENATLMVAATDEEIGEYQDLGIPKGKIDLIRNGINLSDYKSMPQKGLFRKKNNIPKNIKIILYLGRINKLKGLDNLINAYKIISREIKSVLVIAGTDDGFQSELKILTKKLGIEEKVLFPGETTGEFKLQTYQDADVFVYPSPAEGFSLAILEAAASGLPLVITSGCKFPEIESEKAGYIVKSEVKQIISAVIKILKNKKAWEMGAKGKQLVFNKFSIEVMAAKLLKVYSKISIS